jgi:hypothetical protein
MPQSWVFIPLWQRGIMRDFKIMLIKSPLAPLCLSKDREKITKEGYESSLVLHEPVTEGLSSPIPHRSMDQIFRYMLYLRIHAPLML